LVVLVAGVLVAAGLALRSERPAAGAAPPARYSQMPSACGADAGVPAGELSLARVRELILCLHNERRGEHGLPALEYEARLELAAQRHAQDMVRRRYFAHESPDGTGPDRRALLADYPAQHYSSGENLAWGTGRESSPVEIVDGWMHRPGHRENILRTAFTELGVGVVTGVPEATDGPLPGATYAVSFGGPPLPAGG
jgi:uncharacterized protein YkwD